MLFTQDLQFQALTTRNPYAFNVNKKDLNDTKIIIRSVRKLQKKEA